MQTPVGFLTAMTIGDVKMTADQTCKDPLSPEDDLKVVAVLSGALWELGVTDTLHLSGQISTSNQQSIKLLTYKDMTKVDVTFVFTVYDYDLAEKKYFKTMLSTDDATLKGVLEKDGSDLNLNVADDPSSEVQSPENFAFRIGVKPQPSAQQLTIATSFSQKVVKAWGLTVT
ncbi:hypothetical protein [Pseudenhygromyxa sp. WMMC2535]|uniref:hypothetical protein n=1 Tax=Pseudenhygromyxa sp. WMMC2535 TaxID=2712867 RepID=UPI0023DDEDA0|nr:hypothetical protein [Pseudenhygromyxa sp. WMMC2535]